MVLVADKIVIKLVTVLHIVFYRSFLISGLSLLAMPSFLLLWSS